MFQDTDSEDKHFMCLVYHDLFQMNFFFEVLLLLLLLSLVFTFIFCNIEVFHQ